MPGDSKHECMEFEALLSEALDNDGQLSGARKQSFDAHRRICPICGPLFEEAQAGQQWLKSLEPIEPPVHMVHNILLATSGVVSKRGSMTATGQAAPFGERMREWVDSWLTPITGFVRQPRFAMSFGMIFFVSSLVLNVAGVKASDVAKVDLRPAAVRHAYNDAQIKVVKYYDNIRFVYEIESKVRELKRSAVPAEPGPQEQKPERKNDTSGQPDQRQDRNYSMEQGQLVLAALSMSDQATSGQNFTREAVSPESRCHASRVASEQVIARCLPAMALGSNRRFV